MKSLQILLKESIDYNKPQPDMFKRTTYRLPTEEDIVDINNCNLNAEDIVSGFGYTIIGRGMRSPDTTRQILASIQMLIDKYPTNDEYKRAMSIAQGEYE